jgi:hypothetical protein
LLSTNLARGPHAELGTRPEKPAGHPFAPFRLPESLLLHREDPLGDPYATFSRSPGSAGHTGGAAWHTRAASLPFGCPRAPTRPIRRIEKARASSLEKYATPRACEEIQGRSGHRRGLQGGEEVAHAAEPCRPEKPPPAARVHRGISGYSLSCCAMAPSSKEEFGLIIHEDHPFGKTTMFDRDPASLLGTGGARRPQQLRGGQTGRSMVTTAIGPVERGVRQASRECGYRRLTSATDPAMSASRILTLRSAKRLKYRQDLPILCLPSLAKSSTCSGFSATR